MDIDVRSLIGKLNAECRRALEQAAELCVHQTHYNVEIEHLLLKLIEQPAPDIDLILRHFDIKPESLTAQLTSAMDRFKRGNGRTPAMSPHFTVLIQEAWLISSMQLGEQVVRSGSLVLAVLQVDSLRNMLLESAPALLQIPRESLRSALPGILADSTEGAVAPGTARAQPTPGAVPGAGPARSAAKGAATPALDQYTLDLTAQARDGKIDPIRGRDSEIRQIIDVLMRRRQNNPILTGEAGVGKTAVVEGFALSVARGSVPPALRGVAVRTLDLALLQAGAGIKGEFEHRLKSVIAEVKASPQPIILFIDEAHQLIGAGGSEGQGDAANLLKPALARGELRTIAATTWAEYKKYVEKDPALARRFQVIKIDEPGEELAIDMLRGVVENLERHHQVRILDVAVRDAVRLSHRYITGRYLPDKAISVLDTACARVAIGQSGTPPEVEEATRTLEKLETELRILRQESLTGADHAKRIKEVSDGIQGQRKIHKQLLARLEEERQAVAEILALRRKLDERVEGGGAAGGDRGGESSEVADLATSLARLERGLEAIQSDEPMVPVCVDSEVVASVISGWTGIPVGKMMVDEVRTVLNLKSHLAERVVGQDQALDAIARRVRTFRAELDDPGKPVGVFLLVGPSGVGKTETAAALADQLYGGERNMIVVNMSEFQEAHTVSSLKGAPPGYVGYGRGGVLTEAVRRKPYSVVLLDEVEKAHPDVMELFYNVFDKGIMEDGEGVLVDFKNTVILLTSNAGQDIIIGACEGRSSRPDPDMMVEKLRPALLRHFAPAFLGRLVTVPYYPLGDAEIRAIVELKLAKIQERFRRNHQAHLSYDASLIEAITGRCTEVDSGARNVDHILTHSLLPELSTQILELMSVAETFRSVHISLDASGGFAYKFSNQPGVPDAGAVAGGAAGNVHRIGTG
jgi:type VI secretion system protein VasG